MSKIYITKKEYKADLKIFEVKKEYKANPGVERDQQVTLESKNCDVWIFKQQ